MGDEVDSDSPGWSWEAKDDHWEKGRAGSESGVG